MSGGGRGLRLFGAQLRICVQQGMQYRVQFFSQGLLYTVWSLLGVIPLFVALEYRPSVAGWGPWELTVLTGFFMLLSGLFSTFVQPTLIESMGHVRRGSLDYLLLRPVRPLVSCLTALFDPWGILQVVVAFVIIGVGLWGAEVTPSLGQVALGFGVLLTGVAALYALGVLMLSASFRALALENLTYLFESLLDFGRWPSSVFRGLLRAVFTFVVPLAIMTTFPAQALLGRSGDSPLWVAVPVVGGLWAVALWVWRRELKNYTSASS